jgi:hypothetical protein
MAVDYTRLLREFCRFAGYDQDDLTDAQTADWGDVLRTAINQVIHPPLVPTLGAQAHQWSWLRPVWTMETADGQRRYTLPIDFERFVGPLNFHPDEGEYHEIVYYPSQRLMNLQTAGNTGVPVMYSLEPVASEGTTEQVWQRVLEPTPDDSYKLQGQYQIGARMLSSDYPYPPGGPAHGELYIASVLAAAEAKLDDENNGQKLAAFMSRLMADISVDMQRQPTTLGYCGNGRGRMPRSRSEARRMLGGLTMGYTTYNSGTEL